MEITGGNDSQDRQLVSSIVDGGYPGSLLFWPDEIPRRAHAAIRLTLQARGDNFAGVKQEMRVDLVECLTSNWRQ